MGIGGQRRFQGPIHGIVFCTITVEMFVVTLITRLVDFQFVASKINGDY